MLRCLLILLPLMFVPHVVSKGIRCTDAKGPLPTIKHCNELTEAIDMLSRLPGENNMRAWGRRLPTTDLTQNLPKVFWIAGRGPTTCAVHVDVDEDDYFAVDDFRVRSVGMAAGRVVAQCLVARGKIGLAYPGQGHVYVRIVRTDTPFELNVVDPSRVQSLALPNSTDTLQIATAPSGILTSGMLTTLGGQSARNFTRAGFRVEK